MHILHPVIVLAFLTFAVMFYLGFSRIFALSRREVRMSYYRGYVGDGEPERIRVIARHLTNLLEMPTLFYAVSLAYLVTETATQNVIVACWCYVALRLAHSLVHLTTNNVRVRFYVFLASNLVLLGLWINLGIRLA